MTVLQVIIDMLQAVAICLLFRKQGMLIKGVNKLSHWANDIVLMQVRQKLASGILKKFGKDKESK